MNVTAMKQLLSAVLLVSVMSLLAVSCKVRTPKGIMSESTMEDFLYDYHRAQALAGDNDSADYRLRLYTDAVLDKYSLSRNDFERSVKWYSRHADKLYKIYDRINLRLDNEAQVFGASAEKFENGSYAGMTATGDTANVWRGATGALLIPRPGKNLFSFRFEADSTFMPRDKFEWHFDSKFIYQSGKRNAVAVITVRYDNDSLTSVQQQVYGNTDNTVRISAVNLPVKSVEGFVYLEEPKDADAKLLFLSKFALIRFHDLMKRDTVATMPADTTAVTDEAKKKKFIDSIQGTASGEQSGDHFRPAARRRATPREKLLPR